MKVTKTTIPEVLLFEPTVYEDNRGYFMETFRESEFIDNGVNLGFVQDNQSLSKYGTLRGLHYQLRHPQGKLARVISGEIYDVAVDLRKSSSYFGCWVGVKLSSENRKQLWIPPGFAHGFFTLSKYADIQYLVTRQWNKDLERCIIWNDEDIGIDWPFDKMPPLISEKDANGMTLSKAKLSGNIFI